MTLDARHIGFYVHHHGRGHLSRAMAVLRAARDAGLGFEATVLTSLPGAAKELRRADIDADVVQLPLDAAVPDAAPHPLDVELPPELHWAPLGVDGLTQRGALIAAWIDCSRPDLVVVDVSVEVALLCRLLGVPVAYVRQHGHRVDPAHLLAYGVSSMLLAPWPQWMEQADVPDTVRRRTSYTGAFSRIDDAAHLSMDAARTALGWNRDDRHVVALLGVGGEPGDPAAATPARLARAARATPGWRWSVVGDLGPFGIPVPPGNLDARGWVDDPATLLCAADVVVGAGGHNTVMEVAAARRPFVCIPEARPFAEQQCKAAVLESAGAAIVRLDWPSQGEWAKLLESAMSTTCWPSVDDRDTVNGALQFARALAGAPAAALSARDGR